MLAYNNELNTRAEKDRPMADDKYWTDSTRSIFNADGKLPNFRYEFAPEWDDLAYAISRGRVDRVKAEVRMNQEFTGEAMFRPNGETVLHCCAEHG